MLTEREKTVFRIRLAEKNIRIEAYYPSTKQYCAAYLTEEGDAGDDDLTVSVSEDDLLRERERAEAVLHAEKQQARCINPAYLETLAVYRSIAEQMPALGVVLFHGSAVAADGAACLFTAKSGTGKSTHAALWKERFGSRVTIVNDDKPLIGITEESTVVYGTPWNGKHRRGCNIAVPLRAICLLERSETNRIVRISYDEAIPELLCQCYRPEHPDALLATLRLLDNMKNSVRFFRLGCNTEPEAARVAYEGIFGDRQNIR